MVAMKWMMVMIRQGMRGGAIFESEGWGGFSGGGATSYLSFILFTLSPIYSNFFKNNFNKV